MKLFLVLLAFAHVSKGQKLPDDFKVCDHFASDINECLGVAFASALKQLKNGIPAINASPIDPYRLSNMTIVRKDHAIGFYDIDLYNFTTGKLDYIDTKITRDSFFAKMNISMPVITALADYTLKGKLFLFNIEAKGKGVLTMKNTEFTILMSGPVIKDAAGAERFKLTTFESKIHPKSVTFNFGDLVPGQKMVTDQVNAVLTENWEILYKEVESELEKVSSEHLLDYSNNILQYVPV
ncbi:uncharacterized protein LOC116169458 [Photinus pyralis]|nr:uncharacterized protein LOC116169458 [Photinus pyralis]